MPKTHNTLPEEVRIQSAELLNLNLAAAIEDATTADLFTEISRGVDQQLWFVESHLAPKQVNLSKGH